MGRLVVENGEEIQMLSDGYWADGYFVVSRLRSFSSDGRYLAIEGKIFYTNSSADDYVGFVDLVNGEPIPTPTLCQDLGGFSYDYYVGFKSEAEVIVLCTGLTGEDEPTERFESVSLPSGTVRQLSGKPPGLADYGTVSGEFEVTQIQVFQ